MIDAGKAMPCRQQVLEMINPETGDRVRATDGCQIDRLRRNGYISIEEYKSSGSDSSGSDRRPPDSSTSQTTRSSVLIAGVVAAAGLLYSYS